MTKPPLPPSPVCRVHLDYTQADNLLGGSRFYLGYTGTAPTPGNCQSLASGVEAAWAAHMAALVGVTWALTQVDVIDITTDVGASGQWTGSTAGTRGGGSLTANVATNVEFGIARRYRGGKPRMFLPPGTPADLQDNGHWNAAMIAAVNTGVAAFFAQVAGLNIGAMGVLRHVNVSYYYLFQNLKNSSGREYAAPTYRDVPVIDNVQSYIAKGVVGSQRRRRTATSP